LLLNAIVNFYSVTNGVESTTPIQTVRTSSTTGAFSATVTSAGPVVATITTDGNTQMLDEISGNAITAPSGLVLHTVIDSVVDLQPIAVTPLTEIAYGIAKSSSGNLITANIDAANNAVSTAFLAGAPVLYTQPIDIKNYATATAAQQEQAKFLAALAVAAKEGIATGASGSACATTYSANIVCLIGGLGNLLSVSSTGATTLGTAGTYISAAYNLIDAGSVTIGGQTPSALGLDVVTAAEKAFLAAIAQQAPLPGFSSGASPLSNTKALLANVRTNILDQASTQTFGFAPMLTALENDYRTNVHPVLANTWALLDSAYTAAQLLQSATTNTGQGVASDLIENPVALTVDAAGNLYVVNFDNTIVKISGTTATVLAGQPYVSGYADGNGTQATFNSPSAIAVDSAGNLYVADAGNYTIRLISPTGVVSTLAGSPGNFGTTDGTGSAASFGTVTAIAVSANGTVYVADSYSTIRNITSGGVVTTLAIQPGSDCNAYPGYAPGGSCFLGYLGGIAVDGAGNIYVSDTYANTIQVITPSGNLSTFAGQPGISGSTNGAGTAATFNYPTALTLDASGNLYVVDAVLVRAVTPSRVVSTVAGPGPSGTSGGASFGYLSGIAIDAAGGFFVADESQNSIQQVTSAGAISNLVRGAASYQKHCGYDPVGLGTATNVVLCRYGVDQGDILMTVTQTNTGTYTLETQAVAPAAYGSFNPDSSPLSWYTVVGSIPALTANFTFSTSTSGAQSATLTGPYYVNGAGGQVQASLSANESSDWNPATFSGTLTVGGSLSGGAGGISLTTAQIGSNSYITIQNGSRLLTNPVKIVSAGSAPVTVSGAFDLQEWNTAAFSYSAQASLGAPVADKSDAADPPSSITVSGSIGQIGATGTTPLFSGSVAVSLEGFPAFDATKAISSTNYFTAQAQISGALTLSGGRVLTVSATANTGADIAPTPAVPDSISVTYSYATPSGTAELNATGKYDGTDGYKGTITNNSGVVIAVAYPIGGPLTGTVTANGTETATIKGAFIYYSDGTSESLY
jgi:hypothetical protein